MAEYELCPECGVPRQVTNEHKWLSNGDIVQGRAQQNRIAFIECDNLDPLFEGISDIIGMSIEHIVVEGIRRPMRKYLEQHIPDEVRQKVLAGELDPMELDSIFTTIAQPMGYGKYRQVGSRFKQDSDDFFTVSVTEPFSLPICAGSHCAAMEAILGYDHAVSYSQVDQDTYEIIAFPYQQPRTYRGRLMRNNYERQDGDLDLEKCPTCGGPKALSVCEWYIDRGIIINRALKRRMAMIGQMELEPIFNELESELGDTIPQVIVEAQRLFTKTGFYSIHDVQDKGNFRVQLALRGLGNLRELEISRRGLHMLVENAALPMMVVGMMQGIFEMAFDLETDLEWEMSGGNLRIELLPKAVAIST